MKRCNSTRGFTLAEALAALVLIAIVVPVVLRAVSLSTRIGGIATDRAFAVTLAESKIDELIATDELQQSQMQGSMSVAASSATFTEAQLETLDRFDWEATLESWTDATFDVLTVTVTWERRGVEHSVTVSTLISTADAGGAS